LNLSTSLLASLIVLFCACATPPPVARDAAPDYDPTPSYPHWSGQPVTWSKMNAIEDWLAGQGPKLHPEFVAEAELELAEGRLALAQKEANGLAAPLLASRLKAAESGFRSLLDKPGVKPAIQSRAEKGLSQIEALRAAAEPVKAKVAAKPRVPSAAVAASSSPGGLTIEPRSAWNAASPVTRRLTSADGGWSRITIHHSAKYSKEIGTPSSGNVADAIKRIQTVHMRDEGYGDIGYHFLIDPAGRIWQGRSLEWQGAHAGGDNNVENIGICLFGNFNTERPDPRALASLEKLVDALCERHHIPRSRIFGHRQLRSTECPGDSLMAWVSRYAAGATH
jgi:hypothetical protein